MNGVGRWARLAEFWAILARVLGKKMKEEGLISKQGNTGNRGFFLDDFYAKKR